MGNQAFRGTNYLYLTAEHGELRGEQELTRHGNFHVEDGAGASAYLRTADGNYVSANANHHPVLHKEKHSDSCWVLERRDGGVAIRSKHGGYLSMDEKGTVLIKELKEPTEQELFSQISLP